MTLNELPSDCEVIQCPACQEDGVGNAPTYLGELGKFEWFRCRDCGMVFSLESKQVVA